MITPAILHCGCAQIMLEGWNLKINCEVGVEIRAYVV
jgi:hypothetical protein